jgi:hypothetical protein
MPTHISKHREDLVMTADQKALTKHRNHGNRQGLINVEQKFLAFLKRRYKWVAIVGGLIVSLALGIRDHQGEELRNFESSFDNVRGQYLVDKGLGETSIQAEKILLELAILRTKEISAPDQIEFLSEYRARVSTAERSLRILDGFILFAAPLERHWAEDVIILKKRLRELREKREKYLGTSVGVLSNGPINKKDQEGLLHEIDGVQYAIDTYRSNLIGALGQEIEHREISFRITSLICYMLITFGFALSLTGKMFESSVEIPEAG